jgi:ribonuclease R
MRLIHQVLRIEARKEEIPKRTALDKLEEELNEICEHCSYRERLASSAEREAIKLKQVRLIKRHLGDEFEGKIVGFAESGMFIQLNNPYVEGMLPKEALTDDFYEFNEERMVFYGRRKKRTFKIGDKLQVRVVRADIDRRQIDFAPV